MCFDSYTMSVVYLQGKTMGWYEDYLHKHKKLTEKNLNYVDYLKLLTIISSIQKNSI